MICFVPPEYRFSDAMRYFVESYQNSRVDDLKEAVSYIVDFYKQYGIIMSLLNKIRHE